MEKMLPAIPPKRYFTIGEVSDLCGVKPYVLRYWEQEFTQLKPMKRRGNRRYYQHHEVLLIRRIRDLLYDQGFTIVGARNRLTDMPLEPSPTGPEGDNDFELDSGDARLPPLPSAASVAAAALDAKAASRSSVELAMQRPRAAPAATANPNANASAGAGANTDDNAVGSAVPSASVSGAAPSLAVPTGGLHVQQTPLLLGALRAELLSIRELLRV
jgi:DNA-binding transcriptional MerR regulator